MTSVIDYARNIITRNTELPTSVPTKKTDVVSEDNYLKGFQSNHSILLLTSRQIVPPSNSEDVPLLTDMGFSSGPLAPQSGGPFSAIHPSMWPQDILKNIQCSSNDRSMQPEYRYDEFGFRIDQEDGAEPDSNKLLGSPLTSDEQHNLKWYAHLEFTANDDCGNLTWDKVGYTLPRSEKLRELVRSGIPHSMRANLWLRLSGAASKKAKSEVAYYDIIKASATDRSLSAKQIEKDLLRTMPDNACFSTMTSTGVPKLRRILRAVSWLYTDIGYCQGTGMIVSSLLLFMDEEDAFWMMCTIIEDLLPASYYSSTLLGVQMDQRVLRNLLESIIPPLDTVLKEHDIELSLITLHWFLTIYSSVVHIKVLLRIWDLFFSEGSVVLFQITFGLLKLQEDDLVTQDNSAQIFNLLSDLPSQLQDVDIFLDFAMKVSGSLTSISIETQRKKHLSLILAEQGAISGNVGSNVINKRVLRRSKSMLGYLFSASHPDDGEVAKSKNVKQTEILAQLRETISITVKHFHSIDPRKTEISITPDYSIESHNQDRENYVNVARNRRRRAKALLDFERHDDDELGFRKNDIVTIVSMKDEHCWVGELNDVKGWFPAKFVELLDERSKKYTQAGDDKVSHHVTDIIRGKFSENLKKIFEHGMKKTTVLGSSCHPWLFVEEAASREVEKDFKSVYSRLVLCRTYRLDEDGKVLTPEELLYRAVQRINLSHDAAHVQMDVKLRTWICIGLNEQVMHLWLETLASCDPVIQKWYHTWSFLRSPGWVQIKCELRILSKFSFNLSEDWELHETGLDSSEPLKEGVRDMLVKHHLFSWDL